MPPRPRVHDKSYIEDVCHVAGFPPPRFKDDHAIIKVGLGASRGPIPRARLEALQTIPDISPDHFSQWCEPFGLSAIARFVNLELHTQYTSPDIWKWKKGKRKIPARLCLLVSRARPYDPKFPS